MNNTLGVWTSDDCALVLIDFQKEMFESIRSETKADLAELPGVPVIDRTSMNAFEDSAFSAAVKKTGRKRLIIAGLHTEICLTFATVEALKNGYDVMFVTDAVGGRSQVAHRTAIERLTSVGAVPTTALAVNTEMFRDWRSPLAGKALEVIDWYFAEVPLITSDVGVDHRQKVTA